jgi:hypothetical protein
VVGVGVAYAGDVADAVLVMEEAAVDVAAPRVMAHKGISLVLMLMMPLHRSGHSPNSVASDLAEKVGQPLLDAGQHRMHAKCCVVVAVVVAVEVRSGG